MRQENFGLLEGFGQRLKELRQNRGWSQGQLAKKIGGDLQRVSKYEQGVNRPPSEMMIKLADIFEVSLDYLMLGKQSGFINKVKNDYLIKQINHLEELPEKDQEIVALFLESFIKSRKFDELMQNYG